jgi:hypothetical protein
VQISGSLLLLLMTLLSGWVVLPLAFRVPLAVKQKNETLHACQISI